MPRALRFVAIAVGATLVLSACGLAGLIPDQELADGVLGLGGGVTVELAAEGAGTTIDITPTAVTWVGSIVKTFDLDGLAGGDIPNLVSPDGITETIELGDTIVVRNPGSATGPFVVTGLALGGTFTVGGQAFAVPAGLAVDGLAIPFASPDCVEVEGVQECTYATLAESPSLDLAFLSSQVTAYWNLLRGSGGAVTVNLTVTVTLDEPGLPATATVVVTIASAGATITF
jgi:hypothetical protein